MFQPSLNWLKKVSFLFLHVSFFLFLASTTFDVASYSYAIELQSPRFKLDLNQIEVDTERQAEPVVYTIANVYGSEKYNEFNKYGYVVASHSPEEAVSLSLSDSLILISESNKMEKIELRTSTYTNQDLKINLLQENVLSNFSGDKYDLEYLVSGSDIFRSPPVKDSGQNPSTILHASRHDSADLIFRLKAQPQSIEGTYETIINFISEPEL